MIFEKVSIKGKKGQTLIYTLNNVRFDEVDQKLKWDNTRIYTPLGDLDDNGLKFFDIQADEVLIERDDVLTKEIRIFMTITKVEAIEIYEGADMESTDLGLEGDLVIFGTIPAGTEEIRINYKEVYDDS